MMPARTTLGRLPRRRGYALVIVLLFNVLFLALLGIAWRQMVGVIRVAAVREEQIQREEGVVLALARAMRMLETGRPPTTPSPYPCYTTIGTPPRYYVLKFELTDPNVEEWTITVSAQDSVPPYPETVDSFPP